MLPGGRLSTASAAAICIERRSIAHHAAADAVAPTNASVLSRAIYNVGATAGTWVVESSLAAMIVRNFWAS